MFTCTLNGKGEEKQKRHARGAWRKEEEEKKEEKIVSLTWGIIGERNGRYRPPCYTSPVKQLS